MRPSRKMRVVLFEDDVSTAPRICAAVQRKLAHRGECILFKPGARNEDAGAAYEDRLRAELKIPPYKDATLFVTDRDLSRTVRYQGLSEAVVSKVAAQLGIPICKYARGATDDVFDRQRSWGDAQIILDSSDIDSMAARVSMLAQGFLEIRSKVASLFKLIGALEPRTPASAMARILERPELSDQIALYGSGDQKMVAEILPFADRIRGDEFQKRLPSLMGYWLYDSILRFPGLLVNAIAAASYLNISVKAFEDKQVRTLFRSALYRGPFSDPNDPHWWRRDLDEVLARAKCPDGIALAQVKLRRKLAPCLDHGKRAGWYCMVTRKPVSDENSVGNISWFPPGADLARVRKDVYEQIGPWVGLF